MAFKVEIVNINENYDNIILTNGLTIERLKVKYNWILNANLKNCIIGENDNGIVWYSGEWICGEWENGTWYSGIWHDGTWKNGNWYSYLIDKSMIISNRLVILDKDEKYSEFRLGEWKQGNFYDGIFGYDRDISSGITYNNLTGRTFSCAYWEDGKFYSGIFKNSVWINGTFYDGSMLNSYWLNGKFYSGTFNFHNVQGPPNWYGGSWYGGDFIEGFWNNGNFDQIDPNIKSRFGTANSSDSLTRWNGGNFNSGEFHSGLNLDASGNTIPSKYSNKTIWYRGSFNGGKWYGGNFRYGIFNNGEWYGGVFNSENGLVTDCIWNNGNWYNGLWVNGIFNDGHFYDGMWLNGQFVNGYMSTNIIENILSQQILATNVNLPSVTAYTETSITSHSAVANGRVTNNGGATILDRGVCYSNINPLPTTGVTDSHASDGGSMGNISITLTGLIPGNNYYYRVYARNVTGITYSNVISFTTDTVIQIPIVETSTPNVLSPYSFVGLGKLMFSYYPISEYGFIWATGNTILQSGITTDQWQGQISEAAAPNTTGNTEFAITISSVTGETPYTYLAYAISSEGIGSGVTSGFTTPSYDPPTIPTVDTDSATPSIYSAIAGGDVTSSGNDVLTAVGICWNDVGSPTTGDSVTTTPYPTTDPFNVTLTGLTAYTTYYYKAFAINSVGEGYGVEKTFKTNPAETAPTATIVSCTALP